MTTMADLVRCECPCGTIWYQGMQEPKATECNECFRKKRTTMTTGQVNNEFDQTAPASDEETNGHAAVETVAAPPKRQRKAKADPVSEPMEPVLDSTDVLDGIEEQIARLDAEEKAAHERLQRIRDLRARLSGTIVEFVDNSANYSWAVPTVKIAAPGPLTKGTKVKKASSPKRHRRSAAEIQECVEKVVALVKKSKEGLGAQKIREELGLEAKEMPKILKTALAGKLLKSKGQKRATKYFSK